MPPVIPGLTARGLMRAGRRERSLVDEMRILKQGTPSGYGLEGFTSLGHSYMDQYALSRSRAQSYRSRGIVTGQHWSWVARHGDTVEVTGLRGEVVWLRLK